MTGVPPSASLPKIIASLFQNESYEYKGVEYILTFSDLRLTPAQEAKLVFPDGVHPIGIYLLQQTDTYTEDERKSYFSVTAFAEKDVSKHVFGYYFNVTGIDRFHVGDLYDAVHGVNLPDTAVFAASTYIEVYNQLGEKTVILGNSSSPVYSSLQYSEGCKYYYEVLNMNGLDAPDLPVADLHGLSANLEKYVCDVPKCGDNECEVTLVWPVKEDKHKDHKTGKREHKPCK
jgi:hypothetical protein